MSTSSLATTTTTSTYIPTKRITVLISGNGTNLQALIDAYADGRIPHATITHVISDRKAAFGLQRARTAGIPTSYQGILPYRALHPTDADAARRAFDADLATLVLRGRPLDSSQQDHQDEQILPDLVVCAGFTRILTPSFLTPLSDAHIPLVNLHPGLHGDLVGANCIARAWAEHEAGTRNATGVMVHFVIAEVDAGPVIVQREVQITGCASLEELEERMHGVEHGLIVEGVGKVLKGEGV